MSAILKEFPGNEALEQPKGLTELCVIGDTLPDDFYKNTTVYKKQLDDALVLAKSLVHEIDDDGKKKAKADVALIRKFTGNTNKFSLSVFRSLTDKVKLWKDDISVKTKALNDEADSIMSRFEEHEKAKLANIKALVVADLNEQRTALGIRSEFINPNEDVSSIVKLSGTLTPKGLLTTKAIGFITGIATSELALQQRYDNRVLVLKVRCLEVEINPPLPPTYLGQAFYGTDEEFNTKLEELVAAEMLRRAETVAKVERDNKAANEKKIADALADQQAEANRIAKEAETLRVKNESATIGRVAELKLVDAAVKQTPASLRESANRIAESAERADSNQTRRKELATAYELRKEADELENSASAAPTKRTVKITATFNFEGISERVSTQGVVDFFIKQLPEKLAAILEGASGEDA